MSQLCGREPSRGVSLHLWTLRQRQRQSFQMVFSSNSIPVPEISIRETSFPTSLLGLPGPGTPAKPSPEAILLQHILEAGGWSWRPNWGPAAAETPLPPRLASAPRAGPSWRSGARPAEGAGQASALRAPVLPFHGCGDGQGGDNAKNKGSAKQPGASTHQPSSPDFGSGRTSSPSAIAVDVHVTLPKSGPGAETDSYPTS